MSTLNRTKSNHHMSHLSIDEANIVVTEQDLQRQIRRLYLMVEQEAEADEIDKQRKVIRSTELVLRRLKEASAQN